MGFFFVLGYLTNVSVIETEGVTDGSTNAWVESYYVSLSNSSEKESFLNYTEEGDIRIVSLMLIRMCLYCFLSSPAHLEYKYSNPPPPPFPPCVKTYTSGEVIGYLSIKFLIPIKGDTVVDNRKK